MCNGAKRCGKELAGGPQLEQARGPSVAARTDMGSWRLGNYTFGKLPLGEIPLGSCRLGKHLTS